MPVGLTLNAPTGRPHQDAAARQPRLRVGQDGAEDRRYSDLITYGGHARKTIGLGAVAGP
ncbi:hypothetical protein OG361_06155 [Streptomyces sp. NBC_00090]|uniref:hypothetical protein n=1 Tax=Streptomyces sp. NBC_00090 TaxID=2903619 RepID=UPI003248886C